MSEATQVEPGAQALACRASLDVAANPVCRRCVCNLNLRKGDLDGPPARRGGQWRRPRAGCENTAMLG